MPFDINALQASFEQNMGPYQEPVLIFGGIGIAIWLVLAFRALQAHNQSEVAQLDRMLKHK